jgi:hypothetical protein
VPAKRRRRAAPPAAVDGSFITDVAICAMRRREQRRLRRIAIAQRLAFAAQDVDLGAPRLPALAGSGACVGSSVVERRRGGGGGTSPPLVVGSALGCTICVGRSVSGAESGSIVIASEPSITLGSGVALSGIVVGGGGGEGGGAAFFIDGSGGGTEILRSRTPSGRATGGVRGGSGGGSWVWRYPARPPLPRSAPRRLRRQALSHGPHTLSRFASVHTLFGHCRLSPSR